MCITVVIMVLQLYVNGSVASVITLSSVSVSVVPSFCTSVNVVPKFGMDVSTAPSLSVNASIPPSFSINVDINHSLQSGSVLKNANPSLRGRSRIRERGGHTQAE